MMHMSPKRNVNVCVANPSLPAKRKQSGKIGDIISGKVHLKFKVIVIMCIEQKKTPTSNWVAEGK